MAIQLTVKAESRFTKAFTAYDDQVKHGYNPNYVNPQTQRIKMQVSNLPTNMTSWEWRVTRRSDHQVFSKPGKVLFTVSTVSRSEGFNLDSEGVYDCQYIARLPGGKEEKSPMETIHLRDLLVVVIGDSAASGEGNPDKPGKLNQADGGLFDDFMDFLSEFSVKYLTSLFAKKKIAGVEIEPPDMDQPPLWLEKNAHRSLLSGHVQAARHLENLEAGTVVTLLTFARSGAAIVDGLLRPRSDEDRGGNDISWINQNGKIGQLEEVRRTIGKRRIDALIISIGGNDLGFAGSVKDMVAGDSSWIIFDEDDTKARAKINESIDKMLGPDLKSGLLTKTGGHFDQLKVQIDKLNVSNVFLVGYPTGFFDDNVKDGNGEFKLKSCEVFKSVADLDLTGADMRLFRVAAHKLNRTFSTVIAPRYGWHYIDVTTGFLGHGYCAKPGRFFIHCEESLMNQGDIEGMLHPNAQGHEVYESEIRRVLHRQLILKSTSNQPDHGVVDVDVTDGKSDAGKIDLHGFAKPVMDRENK